MVSVAITGRCSPTWRPTDTIAQARHGVRCRRVEQLVSLYLGEGGVAVFLAVDDGTLHVHHQITVSDAVPHQVFEHAGQRD